MAVDLRPHLGKEIFIRLVDQALRRLGAHQLRRLPLPRRPSRTCRRGKACTAAARRLQVRRPAAGKGRRGHDRARRASGQALRRRAGRHAADRLLPRRPRPALGRRGLQLPRPPARQGGQGPHRHLRGHRRRRQVRQAHRLHGGAEPGQRPGGRLRRRLDRRGALPDVRARSRTARTSRPARRKSCSTAGHYQDTHETLNTFTWGPDGWLYGCHGVFTHSRVGKPGTPDARAHPDQRRHLALSPDQTRLRSLRPRHQQSVGPRFRRPRPGVHRGLRHPARLPHHPGRPLPAAGGPALQSVHLRRHQDHRRSPALAGRQPVGRQRPLRQHGRRPRPLPA